MISPVRCAAVLAVTALVLLLLRPAASAQTRENGWIGSGIGGAQLSSSFDDRDSRSDTTGVFYIHFGGWARQRWMVGVELQGLSEIALAGLPNAVYQVTFLGTVAYYPSPSRGWYVKGGVGGLWSAIDLVDEFGTTAIADTGSGFSSMAAIGWDVYMGKRLWLTPDLNFRYARPGDMVLGGQVRVDSWSYRSVDVTLGVKFD